MRLWFALALALAPAALAQSPSEAPGHELPSQTPTLTSQSTLVLVPALVRDKNKAGTLVFTLTVDDFVLTDDGIPQKLHLEQHTGPTPLALGVNTEGGATRA